VVAAVAASRTRAKGGRQVASIPRPSGKGPVRGFTRGVGPGRDGWTRPPAGNRRDHGCGHPACLVYISGHPHARVHSEIPHGARRVRRRSKRYECLAESGVRTDEVRRRSTARAIRAGDRAEYAAVRRRSSSWPRDAPGPLGASETGGGCQRPLGRKEADFSFLISVTGASRDLRLKSGF
jgi:hypothetical protein